VVFVLFALFDQTLRLASWHFGSSHLLHIQNRNIELVEELIDVISAVEVVFAAVAEEAVIAVFAEHAVAFAVDAVERVVAALAEHRVISVVA
jgi:hypothetical protein